MTKLIFNTADSKAATTEFKDTIAANGARQWMDRYGVIKTNKKTIDENVTIPAGTNAVSAGTLTVTGSNVVTIRGEWRIV